ncbi:Tfp pilus assembly protein PilN [Ureibacillus xyleni]|uniref:Tfp pilus assembly protein PilN n=1 Tax=Ureibacillus xyleni TaxID=614648 RepID=A0A285RIR4_9BACL|nr:PilN domain-containing protein [Ureibacillus xyleni]SOB93971.1 Tfp pilus assembly protein PilN [Ureibacillus xyleni]
MIPDINLLPKVERRQNNSKLLYILLAIIALLVLSLLVWQYFSARSNLASILNEEQALLAQRDQLQSELDNINNAKAQFTLEQSVQFLDQISYKVTPLIKEISNLQPTNSYLRTYEFAEKSVTIWVDFETMNDISNYVARLNNSAYFLDVQVSTISNFELVVESENGEVVEDTTNFNEQPRYTTNITLIIDEAYLATGGEE